LGPPTNVFSSPDSTVNTREAAETAIWEWLRAPALADLLSKFGGEPDFVSVTRLAHRSGLLKRTIESRVGSLGEDRLDQKVLARFDPVKKISHSELLLGVLVLLEQFCNEMWNFRSGVPPYIGRSLSVIQSSPLPWSPKDFAVLHRFEDAELLRSTLALYIGTSALEVVRTGGEPHEIEQALVDEFVNVRTDLVGEKNDQPQLGVSDSNQSKNSVGRLPISPTPLLDWLQSGANFEYQERWNKARFPFDTNVIERINCAARELGLIGESRPKLDRYDHVVILGGGANSPIMRASYAAELMDEHLLDCGDLWLLGSPREVAEAERDNAHWYAPGAVDEFGLMIGAACRAFNVSPGPVEFVCGCSNDNESCPTWGTTPLAVGSFEAITSTPKEFQHERKMGLLGGSKSVTVLSASTSNPPQRTNTADTYRMLADIAQFEIGVSVLIVTNQMFVPFQTFDALRILALPHSLRIDVVGLGAQRVDDTVENLLQEILSAIRSARRLAHDLLLAGEGV